MHWGHCPAGAMVALAAGLACLLAVCHAAAGPAPRAAVADKALQRRLEWFQDLRFGLFVHWGVYSQWGCIESWPLVEVDKWARPDDLKAWIERGKDIERFKRDYRRLHTTFNPRRFDPRTWAALAKRAGMKYVVFTTKHHDGFCMFDTKTTDYRITGRQCPYAKAPRANVAKAVFDTFRKEGFGIGVYFSKSDWHSPYYWSPDAPARTRNPNYDARKNPKRWAKFVRYVHDQVEELMTGYGRADILWLDGGQVRPPEQDIRMDRLAAMARKHQPGLIVVDRTVGGKHENYRTPEQEVPDKPPDFVWESCLTMGDQWSYKPRDKYKSTRTLVHLLVDIVSKGGNFLLNVGPNADGEFPAPAARRLEEIGRWMAVNGEAIHGTRAIAPYKVGRVCLTRKGRSVYAIHLAARGRNAPPSQIAVPPLPLEEGSEVRMLGVKKPMRWRRTSAGIVVDIPAGVVKKPPCDHAFVLRMTLAGKPASPR